MQCKNKYRPMRDGKDQRWADQCPYLAEVEGLCWDCYVEKAELLYDEEENHGVV